MAFITTYIEKFDEFNVNVNPSVVAAGTGSGFIWDKEGHVVTNYHVIRNARAAKVVLSDGVGDMQSYNAQVIGVDPDKDVAVLSLISLDKNPEADGIRLKPLKKGSSGHLKVGQTVFAIGNPFGLDHTLTTGIISGLGREVRSPTNRPISNVIQTDAAINPG